VNPSDVTTLIWERLQHAVLSSSSPFSLSMLTSLICALLVATYYLVRRRRLQNRPIRPATILRGLFPKRLARSASVRADLWYFVLATFVFGAIVAWALLSYQLVSNAVVGSLISGFGANAPSGLPDIVTRATLTIALFLAYELAYWFDHYLSHRVPVLWEFHRVHHEATVLTPLTVFRIHPVDGWIHGNITAVLVGFTNGVVNYLFGTTTYLYAINDANLILVLFVHAYIHLQHSQFWIPFSGRLGRVFLSPAHHQVHHSADPAHFNKNLGSCLAIWDWLFGTLYVPGKQPEKLTFGVDPEPGEAKRVHSVARGLIMPFGRAFRRLTPLPPPRGQAAPAAAAEPTPGH
jgi:sterol desaturase/sphingolipid hydroxylase (fatty acid hydroxylase superfamily)